MNIDTQAIQEMRKLQDAPYKGGGRLIVPLSLKNLKFANSVIKQIRDDLQPYFVTTNKAFKEGLNKTFTLSAISYVVLLNVSLYLSLVPKPITEKTPCTTS